jgi:hypothetical protein
MSNDFSNGAETTNTKQGRGVSWNPWLALVFVIIVFFVSQAAAAALISLYSATRHWSHTQALHWLDNSVGGQFVYVYVAETLAILAVYLFL